MDDIRSRLEAFLKAKGVNKSEFGRVIGVSSAYITSIRKSIQPDKIEKISENYPELNIEWLLTGDGEMMRPSVTQTVGDIHGDANGVNVNGNVNFSASVDKLLDEISAQRRLTEKAQEQVDRLLNVIEQLSKR